jgi:hypothetical protein
MRSPRRLSSSSFTNTKKSTSFVARDVPHIDNAQAPISAYGTRSLRKQATIRAKSSGALPPEISVTLFLPFLYLARLNGTEASEQQPPLLLDVFVAGPGMIGSYGFPKPTARRFGQLGALAESSLRRAGESDSFHLSFHEIHPPKPKGNFS